MNLCFVYFGRQKFQLRREKDLCVGIGIDCHCCHFSVGRQKIKIKWAHVPVNIFQSARRKPFFARQKRLTALSRKIFLSTEVDKKIEFGGGLWGIVVLSTEVDKKGTTSVPEKNTTLRTTTSGRKYLGV